jgi:hypothetical protein
MIQVRDAVSEDAGAIADLLGELGYSASAAEIPARLVAVAKVPGRVLVEAAGQQATAWGCETRSSPAGTIVIGRTGVYVGLGFESGSRKFARAVAL